MWLEPSLRVKNLKALTSTKAEAAKIFADSIYGEFYPYEGNTKNRADEFKIVSPKIKGVF